MVLPPESLILFEFLPQQQREHNCGYQKPCAIQKGKNPLCDGCRHALFALHSFLTSCSCYVRFVFVLTACSPRHFLRRRLTAGLLPESVYLLFAARLRSSRRAFCSIVRAYTTTTKAGKQGVKLLQFCNHMIYF